MYMKEKFNLGNCIEFYITNECNLTCSNCNRYNNYDFQGHYEWNHNAEAIAAWAERIDASIITIIGGEPTLHPDLQQWAEGLAALWPDRDVMIQTNGIKPIIGMNWWETARSKYPNIGHSISVHSPGMKSKLSRGRKNHFDAWMFSECALKDQHTYFTVHDSDPQAAFNACSMKHSHTVLNGRLYKCPMVAILPEFRKQYQVSLTERQESILLEYRSLAHDCSDQELENFVNDRHSAIKQCNLCPGSYKVSHITFDPKRKARPRFADA